VCVVSVVCVMDALSGTGKGIMRAAPLDCMASTNAFPPPISSLHLYSSNFDKNKTEVNYGTHR
jgi:hypothetical protein